MLNTNYCVPDKKFSWKCIYIAFILFIFRVSKFWKGEKNMKIQLMPLKYFFKTEFPKISGGSVKVSQCTSCTIDYKKKQINLSCTLNSIFNQTKEKRIIKCS